MAVERLNAAELSIDDAGKGRSMVTVKNTGASTIFHGPTDVQQCGSGRGEGRGRQNRLLHGRRANGYLPKGSIVYNTVFGDGKGNTLWTTSPRRARSSVTAAYRRWVRWR